MRRFWLQAWLRKSGATALRLIGKSPLANKMQKIKCFPMIEVPDAGGLSLFKAFLHNCGRAGILSKQLKKNEQNSQMS